MYINQVPLSQFQIVYAGFPNGLALAAETLRDALAARLSLTLPCGKDTDLAPSPFEVRIGCTNRKQNEAATPLLTYSFTVAGSILQLTCGGAFSACRAVDALCAFLGTQTALSLSDGVFLQTDLRGEMVPRTEESNLRVMTSNILAERWNNHPERYLTTAERAEIYAAVLARYTPDLIGVQETDAPWAEVLPDCLAIVKSVYGLHFQWIEYQFGELANMSSVIFNADRFTLLAKDTVEFSYHVNSGRPYKIRTMAYGVWQDRETDKTMILINTHWATESKFETEQITDRERVLGIFTAVMSVIPMIEIIVSFFKEVG